MPQEVTTVEFSQGLSIDLVYPNNRTARMPLIIWVHGGGWRLQDRTARPDFAKYFTPDGFVMASVDYRLAPANPHPSQVDDLLAATQYLQQHAEQLQIDPERIGYWGSSAGGHVAVMAALANPSIRCVVNGYGPADIPALLPPFPHTGPSTPEQDLLGGTPQTITEDATQRQAAKAASPVHQHIDSAPPMLIMHGTADNMVPAEQSIRLHEHLSSAGQESTLVLIEDFGHGFFNPGNVLELGPGIRLDNGRLEREPQQKFSLQQSSSASFDTTGHGANHELIAAFFAHHLLTPQLEG